MSEYFELDREILGRIASLYAVHVDGRRCYYRISYNHSTSPAFTTDARKPRPSGGG